MVTVIVNSFACPVAGIQNSLNYYNLVVYNFHKKRHIFFDTWLHNHLTLSVDLQSLVLAPANVSLLGNYWDAPFYFHGKNFH